MQMETNLGPVTVRERSKILDVWRGFALLGIAMANFPEFSLWTFMSPSKQAALPWSGADDVVHYLLYMLVDGKFYTLFSLLFGIGFSIILSRRGWRLFVRRMTILFVIGFCHRIFLWSGDILLLYAVAGLLLTLFIPLSDRWLFRSAILLLLLPIGFDAIQECFNMDWSAFFYNAWWQKAYERGITEENFATWLVDAKTYDKVFDFLIQGTYERTWELVSGFRLFKVLGLFILGYLFGKHRLYTRLAELPLRRIMISTLSLSLPLSALYAWSAVGGHPWGNTVHSILYTFSVYPTAIGYACGLALLFLSNSERKCWDALAAPGRMALTCYILQTIIGRVHFYGIGFGLGASLPLAAVEVIAIAAFILEILVTLLWLRFFRFGPLEWIWRMLTYGKHFPLLKQKE